MTKLLKITLLPIALFLGANAVLMAGQAEEDSAYCDGWEKGYPAGWCYQRPMCFPPMTPMCPMPKFMRDTFEDGYNDGFVQGQKDHDN